MNFGEEGMLMAEESTKTTRERGNGFRKWFRVSTISPRSPNKKGLTEQLEDAERLLNYAAKTGVTIDDHVREAVLDAKATITDKWDKQTAAYVLLALTSLSKKLTPVTAESLK